MQQTYLSHKGCVPGTSKVLGNDFLFERLLLENAPGPAVGQPRDIFGILFIHENLVELDGKGHDSLHTRLLLVRLGLVDKVPNDYIGGTTMDHSVVCKATIG